MSQEIVVGFIVLGAALYLARTVWNQTRGKSSCGCGKGGGCASGDLASGGRAGNAVSNKTTPSSTRNGVKGDVKLPSHLLQITPRDKANLN